MPSSATALDARYGRTPRARSRRRLLSLLTAVVVAGLVVAWALWTGIGGATTSLEEDTVATTVHDERSVTVRWLVTGRAGTALVCAIEARDASGITVGLVEQTVPVTGRADRAGQTLVRTTRLASTGLIDSCRDA